MTSILSINLCIACLSMISGHATASSLWMTHGMDRVSRERAPEAAWQPRVTAARGEWEGLQLIVNAPATSVKGTLISASPLHGPDDALIPAPVVLREHYVTISKSSQYAPLPPGSYPDALVPQLSRWQDLPSSGTINQPFWIDVYIPDNAMPGDYKGKLTATLGSGEILEREFTVHVWDFALPRLPSMKSSIFIVWRRIAKVHGFDPEANTAPPALQNILDDYYDMLVEHRLSPHEVWATYPDATDPTSDLSFQHLEKGLRKHLLQRQAGTIGLPLWPTWPVRDPLGKDRAEALAYVARYYRVCEKLGCADRLYKVFGELDEPNSPEQYALVREWGRFFEELRTRHGVKIPLLITEQPLPDNKAWGSLVGSVDIWSAHVGEIWKDIEAANPTKTIKARIKAGEQVWAYTALVQAPEVWKAMHMRGERIVAGNPPVWLTDYPAMNYRILPWVSALYGINGLTYWDTSHWPDGLDVWRDNNTYPHDDEAFNGDGFLVYAARDEAQGREGPVASIRLKWIRESMDDHDYLQLVTDRGFKQTASELTKHFARGFGDWEDNIPALYDAREQLARVIEKLNSKQHASR